jgi:DNA-binding transcriptional MerR regulator
MLQSTMASSSTPIPAPRPGSPEPSVRLTVDELSRAAGTTTRQVRALQTHGLLPRPHLVGRTGYYDAAHLDRLRTILSLQAGGFSLAALATLFRAWDAGATLAQVLGLPAPDPDVAPDESDVFDDVAGPARWASARQGRPLYLVPSTILEEAAAS